MGKLNLLWAIPLTTTGLGVWQIQRLQWKQNLIAQAERHQKLASKLPEEITEEKQFMRIKESGEYINEKEMLCGVRPRNQHGFYDASIEHVTNSGYLCITPFKLSSGKQILVNRGWLSRDDLEKDRKVKGKVEIEGCLREGETKSSMRLKNEPENNLWYSVDLPAMAQKSNSEPVLVELTADSDLNKRGVLYLRVPSANFKNNHMEYAITW
ncbi:surf-like protein [Boothiomyces sp. JEL0866]|nr:surf-like protein [Boothiomyces sp. JEL0866]